MSRDGVYRTAPPRPMSEARRDALLIAIAKTVVSMSDYLELPYEKDLEELRSTILEAQEETGLKI